MQQDQQQIQPKHGSVWPEDEGLLCQSFKKESLDKLNLDILSVLKINLWDKRQKDKK